MKWFLSIHFYFSPQEEKNFINSRIIAASLGRGRHIELPQPVQITFKHLNEVDPARVRPQCVYWDYTENAWSEDGCHAVMSNITHTHCSCNHLTNFALLMSHSNDHIAPSNKLLGKIPHIKSLITIFGHKHKFKDFIKKMEIFHKKIWNF